MDKEVYAFDLKMICGGYVYFSTYTSFERFGKNHREFRKPCTVSKELFSEAARELGHNPIKIENDHSFNIWLNARGWAIIEENFVRKSMQQWLKSKECINSATGVFTDIEISSPSTLKRTYSGVKKKQILARDGGRCLRCGAETKLTMQHVIPYSKGGESTSRNLVTLCEPCNQSLADEMDLSLFSAAGLHYDYDRALINHRWFSDEQRFKASLISDNLMQTRCEVW